MILFAIFFIASAEESQSEIVGAGTCVGSPHIRLDTFNLDSFPPPEGVLTFTFKATLMSPLLVDRVFIDLYGSDGYIYQEEAFVILPPIPYPSVEFTLSVPVSGVKIDAYSLQVSIANCFGTLACYENTFAVWRNL